MDSQQSSHQEQQDKQPPMQLVLSPLPATRPLEDELTSKQQPKTPQFEFHSPETEPSNTNSPTAVQDPKPDNGDNKDKDQGSSLSTTVSQTTSVTELPAAPPAPAPPASDTANGLISRLSLYKPMEVQVEMPPKETDTILTTDDHVPNKKIVIPLRKDNPNRNQTMAASRDLLVEASHVPFRLKRKSRVQSVEVWEETNTSLAHVAKKLALGENTKVLLETPGSNWVFDRSREQRFRSCRVPSTFCGSSGGGGASRSGSSNGTVDSSESEDTENVKNLRPLISCVDYDHRYLQLDETEQGRLYMLVRPPFFDPSTFARHASDDEIYLSLPDMYDTRTSSSIGRHHQARVPVTVSPASFREDPDFSPYYDEPGTIWDPERAQKAVESGEDLYSFIDENRELVQKEFRMEILHVSNYSVAAARASYRQLCKYVGGEPTSQLTKSEKKTFLRQLLNQKKNFSIVAAKISRRPLECMVHYYQWKRTCPGEYKKLKTDAHTDYCYECGDGGDLLICDECDHAYHKKCLTPPLEHVPKGNWYCPYCEPVVKRRGVTQKPKPRPKPAQTVPKATTTPVTQTVPKVTTTQKSNSLPQYSPQKSTAAVTYKIGNTSQSAVYNLQTNSNSSAPRVSASVWPEEQPRYIPQRQQQFLPNQQHHSYSYRQPMNNGYLGQPHPSAGYYYNQQQQLHHQPPYAAYGSSQQPQNSMAPTHQGSKVLNVVATPAPNNNFIRQYPGMP